MVRLSKLPRSSVLLRVIVATFAAVLGGLFITVSWMSVRESSLNHHLAEDVQLMASISHQRALGARIVTRASMLRQSDPESRSDLIEEIESDLRVFKSNQSAIAQQSANGLDGSSLSIQRLTMNGEDLIRLVEDYVQNSGSLEDFTRLKAENSAYYTETGRMVHELQSATVDRLERLKEIRSGLVQRLLMAVIVLGLIIFIPASLKIRRLLRESDQHRHALEHTNSELTAAQTELEGKAEQLEQALEQSSSQASLFQFASLRFQQLFGGLPVGCLTYDQEGNVQEWNNAMTELFEQQPFNVCYQSLYKVFSDPTQSPVVKDGVQRVLSDAEECEFEWEQNFADGRIKHFYCVSYPLRGQSGVVLGGILAAIDISSRKQAEEQLASVNHELHETLESIKDCFFSMDEQWRFVYVNSAAAEHLGRRPEDMIGQTIWEAEPRIKKTVFERNVRRAKKTGTATTFEMLDKVRGKWFEFRVYPTSTGMSVFYQEITERKTVAQRIEAQMREINEKNEMLEFQQGELEQANQRLAAVAETDGLTGLKNHKAFQQNLAASFAEARKSHKDLSLILLDVDHFKLYNDGFGHPAGDQVLKQVGVILRQATRGQDLVARYGGEEFVIVLSDTGKERVLEVAERIRSAIENSIWPKRPITVSLGCSTLGPDIRHKQDLIDRADEALYASKRNGRNQVTFWTERVERAA